MRILIATVTAGGGHLAAAAALEEAWKAERPGDQVQKWDLLQFFTAMHRRVYSEGYIRFADRAPELWGMVFKVTDDPSLARKLAKVRRLFPSQSRSKFRRQLEKGNFDAVLCTHYLPLETLGLIRADEAERNAARRPFVASVVTDFEAHALWMDPCVDLYCVAHEATGARLQARGARKETIVPTGIPIGGRFSATINAGEVRRRMGLRDDLPILLVLSGGFGMGPVAEILVEMDKVNAEFQIVVVSGRNTELRADLATRDYRHPVKVLGFADNMHELMNLASLVVTKPGGLTSSEALAVGRPLLIVNPIPGQEAANSDFLLERGAAAKVNRVVDIPYKLEEVLQGPHLAGLSKAAKALGRPDAARQICREVVQRLGATA